MRIRYALPVAVLALIVWCAPSSAADRLPRNSLSKVVTPEKLWRAVPLSVTSDVAETEPNDDFASANAAACGDAIRPAAIDYADDIDWISFTANAGELITIGTDADGASPIEDTIIGLFDAAGNQLAIDDDSGPGLYSLITDYPAPATGVYYFGIIAYDIEGVGTYQGFISCAAAPAGPPNDLCAGAIELPCGDIDLAGTTAGALDNYSPGSGGCTGYAAAGRDVVYKLEATAGDALYLSYTTTADGSIYIISDCADAAGSCIVGSDATLAGETESIAHMFTSPGTYYLVLDSYGANTYGDWTLTGSRSCGATNAVRASWGSLKQTYR